MTEVTVKIGPKTRDKLQKYIDHLNSELAEDEKPWTIEDAVYVLMVTNLDDALKDIEISNM